MLRHRNLRLWATMVATWPTGLGLLLCFFAPHDIVNYIGFSVGLVEIPEIVKVITTLFPALRTLPVLGRIIPLFNAGDMNEHQALEQMQRSADNSKARRTQTKQKEGKHVIKVSDALQCVEDSCFDSTIALALLKNLCRNILGVGDKWANEIIYDRIAACMLNKALQQNNRRKKGKFVSSKGMKDTYTEIVSLRKGNLHPFLPDAEG